MLSHIILDMFCSNNISTEIEQINKEIASTLKRIEGSKFKRDINELQKLKETKGKSAAVFSLKDKILGKKKIQPEQVVLTDPVTGNDVYSPEEIKRVTIDYLMGILKTKVPKGKYVGIVNKKEELHFERMQETVDNDLNEFPCLQTSNHIQFSQSVMIY